jgi:MFS transporter, SHS family, sialic acid transporter
VALVMESWSAHARPMLAGLIGAAANVGYLAIASLGLVVPPEGKWRVLFFVCVVPALLTFLLRTFVPESKRWEQAAASGPRARMRDIFVPGLRSRSLLGAAIGSVALLATWGAVQWIPLWIKTLTSQPHAAVVAQMCSAAGAVVGCVLAGQIGFRLGRRLMYFSLCALSMLVCEFLVLGGHHGSFDVWFLGTIFAVGLLSASFYGWLPLYLPELFPTRVRATGQGFCYNFGRSLAAVGVLLTTFVVDVGGRYALASALVCLIYLVGMALAWFIPETRGQPLPE